MEMTTVNQETAGKFRTDEVIESLRNEAKTSPVFNAVCNVFALRERTRQQVTVHSLFAAMTKEGFSFSKEEYGKVLHFLSTLRLGKIQRDSKGSILALTGITMTLQSIGLASISNMKNLNKTKQKPVFVDLPLPKSVEKPVIIDSVLKKPMIEKTLSIRIGHKNFLFDLFPESKIKEVLDLIDGIYQQKQKKGV